VVDLIVIVNNSMCTCLLTGSITLTAMISRWRCSPSCLRVFHRYWS